MTGRQPNEIFDAYYFSHGCGDPYERSEPWLRMFRHIAERIVAEIAPATVLDAGCAMGFLVEMLRERGVEAYGVDVSDYAISRVHPAVAPFCRVASISAPLERRYDLIVCIEVLEHLPAEESAAAVANLCRHSDDILFSSTPFDYREASHFNVQPPEYWAAQFARHGFFRDVDFDAGFITEWAVRFRRRSEPLQRIVQDYERKFWPLRKENQDLRGLAHELHQQLAGRQAELQQHAANEAELHAYIERLHAELAGKQAHIAELKSTIGRLESGRLLRLLRLLPGRRKA